MTMKWKIAIICFCYLVGGVLFAAWYIEMQRMVLDPPNGIFNANKINWMVKTGAVFLFLGSSVLTSVLVESAYTLFVRVRSRQSPRGLANK